MSITMQSPAFNARSVIRVKPSILGPNNVSPFTLDQELKPFGKWVDSPIWVPPKDSSSELAKSMLSKASLFKSKSQNWKMVEAAHQDSFTQVREIEMAKASIRLPKRKLFVSVTERKHFDRITDVVPACVQTRLDEFLAGPGKKPGVKVYYLKPLCIELGDELLFTTRQDVENAIAQIQEEVFSHYRRQYLPFRAKQACVKALGAVAAVPCGIADYVVTRRQRSIDAFQARLEFRRRQTALDAAKTYQRYRTTGCTFDEMLEMTTPLKREAVIKQYSIEQELSRAKQAQLLRIAAGQLPWFALTALTTGLTYMSYVAAASLTLASPLLVCDPAFVAELPGSDGAVLNIGHFDEIRGVRHIEM